MESDSTAIDFHEDSEYQFNVLVSEINHLPCSSTSQLIDPILTVSAFSQSHRLEYTELLQSNSNNNNNDDDENINDNSNNSNNSNSNNSNNNKYQSALFSKTVNFI